MSASPGADATGTAEPSLRRDPRLYAVLMLAAAAPTSVAVVSPTLPAMADALGVPDARIGLVMTAITLPPMLLAPVVGVASDLLGRRTVALPALALFGAAGVAIAFVDSFGMVLVLRGLQGVAMAGIAPVAITLLGDLYRGPRGTTAQGLRTSVAGVTLTVTPLVAGWLAGIAWNVPFLIYGVAIVIGVAIYRFVPETAAAADDGRPIRAALADYAASVRAELGDPRLVVLLGGGFVRFFSLFAFLTFVPIFAVRALDATTFEAGVVVAVTGVRVLVSPTAGLWVARLGRHGALLASLGLLLAAFVLIPLAPSVWALAAIGALHATGDAILSPVVNDAVTSAVGAANRNGVVSALRVLKEAGKTAAPVVLGAVLAVAGYQAVFLGGAAVVVAYVLAVLLVR